METFYFGILGEWREQEQDMMVIGNVEKITAETLEAAKMHYQALHRLHRGWEDDDSPFEIVQIIKD